jgi:hypothetical protein
MASDVTIIITMQGSLKANNEKIDSLWSGRHCECLKAGGSTISGSDIVELLLK